MSHQPQTFWEHLDELRGSLLRAIAAIVVFTVTAFLAKEILFDIVLAPQRTDFITYRLFEGLQNGLQYASSLKEVPLINTGLAQQFLIHVRVAFYAGIILTSPYILYLLFHFISPALYQTERRYAISLVGGGYVMFVLGLLLSYFLIFPLTFRFLGAYQVSETVMNAITLDSYVSTLATLSLCMGIVFEIPVVCWLLGKMGLITATVMRRFRRHVVVAILILAAIITPTSDIFTLSIVSLPMWLLYEAGILIVRKS